MQYTQYVWTDDEFCSAADIKDGVYQYLEHPSTRMLCKAWFTNHRGIVLMTFSDDRPHEFDRGLAIAAEQDNVIFVAHNAVVERTAWRLFMVPLGYPDIPLHRWKCTMAKAWAHGLPGKLKQVAEVLELPHQKSESELFKILWKPKKDGTFWTYYEKPALFEQMYEYNIQDTLCCRDIDLSLHDLIPSEQRLWEINERMNEQGIMLDMPLVHRILSFIEYYESIEHKRFNEITGIARPSMREQFGDWLNTFGYALPKTAKGNWSTGKDAIKKLIPTVQHPWVMEALRLFQAGNLGSLAKYDAMVRFAPDGLLREILAYYAAHTGRYGGRRVQLQNLPRPVVDIINAVAAIQNSYDVFRWMYD